MPEPRIASRPKSRITEGRMNLAELGKWYDALIPKLRVARGVRNATDEFRTVVLDSLQRFGFTRSHALLAERWLEMGRWNEYRATGIVTLIDFIPTQEQLRTIGDVDELVMRAARKIIADLARTEYIHRARVAAMIDEVRIDAVSKAKIEFERHNELKWQMLADHKTQKNVSNLAKNKRLKWRFHPRFGKLIVLHSRKKDV